MQFADDTLLFVKADEVSFGNLKKVLVLFENMSGLAIHFSKSSLFLLDCSDSRADSLASSLGCKIGSLPFTYLGFKLGISPKRVIAWSPIVEK